MVSKEKTFTRASADNRRKELIAACARVLGRDGAAGISVRAICREAGVSPGLLTHHFGGIAQILAETYLALGADISAALDDAVQAAGADKRAQLLAYLTASFQPPIASAETLSCYVAFWTLTRSDCALAGIRAQLAAAYQSRLVQLLCRLVPPAESAQHALALGALIDGLWLELSMDGAIVTAAEARALVEDWLNRLMPAPA